MFFWVSLVPKTEFFQTARNLVQGYIAISLFEIWCLFFQFFCHFFGQIWSQNPKFSKLTEIRYKDTLLYAYYNFNVYVFKSFVIHIILAKFGPKIWFCPNWLESRILVHYWYYMFHIVFSRLSKFHRISMLNFSKYGKQQVLG